MAEALWRKVHEGSVCIWPNYGSRIDAHCGYWTGRVHQQLHPQFVGCVDYAIMYTLAWVMRPAYTSFGSV